jgi:dATP/dGTP diphosphohydrolase
MDLKDSGGRREFGTGSVRDLAVGKGSPHLLPFRAINLASRQMERGALKYAARNWELGQPLSSYFDSQYRHLTKHWNRWTDEPHLDAMVWNALAYAETFERIRLGILPMVLDDRPELGIATKEEMDPPNK